MSDSFVEFWTEVWEIRAARWVIYLAAITTVTLVAVYVGKFFRDMALGGTEESVDYLAQFEQLKQDGKLGEREYARLKDTLRQSESGGRIDQPGESDSAGKDGPFSPADGIQSAERAEDGEAAGDDRPASEQKPDSDLR